MQVIRIKIKGYDSSLVESAIKKIVNVCRGTGALVSGPVPLPTRIKRWTVLRSPNIDKRSQETYEMRISSRVVDIINSNQRTIDSLKYLELPSGISADIKIINKKEDRVEETR